MRLKIPELLNVPMDIYGQFSPFQRDSSKENSLNFSPSTPKDLPALTPGQETLPVGFAWEFVCEGCPLKEKKSGAYKQGENGGKSCRN